jgi:hypothetical protein
METKTQTRVTKSATSTETEAKPLTMRLRVSVVVGSLALLLAGCGAEGTTETTEQVAEPTQASEPTQAAPRDAREAAADEAKKKAAAAKLEGLDPIMELLACQASEVNVDLSPEEVATLENETLEGVGPQGVPNIQTFLAERGYTCGGRAEELLAMTPEERMATPSDEKLELVVESARMQGAERSKMAQE